MNDSGTLAKRYAEALFNLSLKEKNLGLIEKAFAAFVKIAGKNPNFVNFMESPVIPYKSKEAFLEKIIPQGTPSLLVFFLKLVAAKKRFGLLVAIETAFQQRSERLNGVYKAELVTAAPMEPATEKKLIAILEKRQIFASGLSAHAAHPVKVQLATKTDTKLIGGFILKFDESVIDASYRTKLREMKQRLCAAAV